jgi:hypothetical protein
MSMGKIYGKADIYFQWWLWESPERRGVCARTAPVYPFVRDPRKERCMAKYEKHLTGSFEGLLRAIEDGILRGSISASLEGGSDYARGDFRCAARVYERYSVIGSNRLSMSITLVGDGNQLFLSAITAGGSQAIFLKINTLGENAFLDKLIEIVENFRG